MVEAINFALARSRYTMRVGLIAAALALFCYGVGDEVERRMFPVLVAQSVVPHPIVEGSGRVCWSWSLRRMRRADPIDFAWSMRLANGWRFPVVPIRPDGAAPQIRSLDVGSTYTREFCAAVPEPLTKDDRIAVTGFGLYQTFTPWPVRQDFPEVRWNGGP